MTTAIECSLDAGRVQFIATVDNDNKWTFSKSAPKLIVDNLLPDFKRAGNLMSVELTGKQFDEPSQRYAARVVERLSYMFSSMQIVEPTPPKKRGRRPKAPATTATQPATTAKT